LHILHLLFCKLAELLTSISEYPATAVILHGLQESARYSVSAAAGPGSLTYATMSSFQPPDGDIDSFLALVDNVLSRQEAINRLKVCVAAALVLGRS